jgi:hypothetical protein
MRHIATALKSVVLTLTLMLSGPVLAAGFACAQPPDLGEKNGALVELEEVVVTGAQVKTRTNDLQAWLKLLVGNYTYEGYVDLCGNGNAEDQRPVTGKADCVDFGSTPNVRCGVNVHWPAERGENGAPVLGGVSNLQPAFVIYGLENRYIPEQKIARLALMFMQVDSEGVTERASGALVGDTFTSRETCVGMPWACQKITRITARPGSDEISMRFDVERNGKRVLRQSLVLRRASNVQEHQQAGATSP